MTLSAGSGSGSGLGSGSGSAPGSGTAADSGAAIEACLRRLPSVDKLRRHPTWQSVDLPSEVKTLLCREAIAAVRSAITTGSLAFSADLEANVLAELTSRQQAATGPSLVRLLNGTGVLLHTNAGRAPLPIEALEAIEATAQGYCNLELVRATGKRGSRQDHVRPLLRWLTGAEDALVVNNGAAAVLLALHALAAGRPVLVSRGELVEIGGGFRVPEVMTAAGAVLHEVGTTNRTHLRDYQRGLDRCRKLAKPVAALLQVHRSNFALVGFTATPLLAELAQLAHAHDLPLVVDLGSGAMQPLPQLESRPDDGPPRREPTVREVLEAGADVVTFSGDKLVGGPQAGLIVGKAKWIQRLAHSPMARALRVDNLTLAALEPVLRLHLRGEAPQRLPALHALTLAEDQVDQQAQAWASALQLRLGQGWQVTVEPAVSRLGGGTDPLVQVPSRALSLRPPHGNAANLQANALRAPVPLLGRVRGERLLLDVRSLIAGLGRMTQDRLVDQLVQALSWTRQ